MANLDTQHDIYIIQTVNLCRVCLIIIMLSVLMLIAIILGVVMLSVIVMNVVMLGVLKPRHSSLDCSTILLACYIRLGCSVFCDKRSSLFKKKELCSISQRQRAKKSKTFSQKNNSISLLLKTDI